MTPDSLQNAVNARRKPVVEPIRRMAYSRREFAASIGISLEEVDILVRDLKSGIPFIRFGRRVMFPVAPAEQWLAELAKDQAARLARSGGESKPRKLKVKPVKKQPPTAAAA